MVWEHGPKKRKQSFVTHDKLPKRFKGPNILEVVLKNIILSDLSNQPLFWICT